MKTHKKITIAVILAALTTPLLWAATTPTNLTQDTTVRENATYTYYARGNATGAAIDYFTTMFFPGAPSHSASGGKDNGLDDSVTTPAPISFTTGYLTDAKTNTSVSGWVNIEESTGVVTNEGTFNIVFDLGNTYMITSVIVTYTDTGGQRWSKTVDAQKVYTSLTAPSSENIPADLFGTATATQDANNGSLSFTGTEIIARYVTLELAMLIGANPNSGSAGGIISEITIMGYSVVPEPSTTALLTAVGLLISMPFLRKLFQR
ncbi:hypothetical protein OpiT1DRAFT_03165 [Opitutaceae bacterium TAV1]|nr:hypothetical protein OpiT1DRAFT_03165 [Opitutaceae bacterium TAV1]